MTWQAGQIVLDEYEVIRRLGAGGMASVYLVQQVDAGHQLALKVPHRHLLTDSQQHSSFLDEAQTWVSLPEHPQIVQCYFLRELDGCPLIFAEYVASGSLESWIHRRRIHGLRHVIDLALQLAEAMWVAEQLGVVHRDLKPANCFLTDTGLLKVGDFSLAGAVRRGGAGSVVSEQGGVPLLSGTQSYCSPEQFDGKDTDVRTDIWSFGVTLLELLSGRRPQFGPAAPELAARIIGSGEYAFPVGVWRCLFEILEPDRSKRVASFGDVREQLRTLYTELTGQEYPRQFPQPGVRVRNPETVQEEDGRSKWTRARRILQQALEDAGRDPCEADGRGRTVGGRRSIQAEYLAAISLLKQASQIYRGLLENGPAHDPLVLRLVGALGETASVHRALGNLSAARKAYDECVGRLQASLLDRPSGEAALLFGLTIHDRAVLRRQTGDTPAAIRDYDRAIKLFERLDAARFGNRLANVVASLYQNRGLARLSELNVSLALMDATRAVQMREHLAGSQTECAYAVDLAGSLLNRGVIRRRLGQTDEALRDYEQALRWCADADADGQFVSREDVIGQVHLNRSALFLSIGQHSPASEEGEQAVDCFRALQERTGDLTALIHLSAAHNNVANAQNRMGNAKRSLEAIQRCIELREELVQRRGQVNQARTLAQAYFNQSLFLCADGRFREASPIIDRAVTLLESIALRKHQPALVPELARLRSQRGFLRLALGQSTGGHADFAEALGTLQQLLASESAARNVDVVEAMMEAMLRYVLGACGVRTSQGLQWPGLTVAASALPECHEMLAVLTESLRTLARITVAGTIDPSVVREGLQKLDLLLRPVLRQCDRSKTDELRRLLSQLRR